MFIEALFIIGRNLKKNENPRYPLTEELIKKMWYIYTMEYYSHNGILFNYEKQRHHEFCRQMDGS